MRLAFLFFFFYLVFLILFSVIPAGEVGGVSNSGFLGHLIAYIVLGGLLCYVLVVVKFRYAAVIAFVVASGIGFLIELVQYFIPYRYFDHSDVVINVVGAFVGVVLYLVLNLILKNKI